MDLISNIGLLPAEELTGEPNDKYLTFNKEPSLDNDESDTILIGDLCVFEIPMVYCRGLLGKRHKYTRIQAHNSS